MALLVVHLLLLVQVLVLVCPAWSFQSLSSIIVKYDCCTSRRRDQKGFVFFVEQSQHEFRFQDSRAGVKFFWNSKGRIDIFRLRFSVSIIADDGPSSQSSSSKRTFDNTNNDRKTNRRPSSTIRVDPIQNPIPPLDTRFKPYLTTTNLPPWLSRYHDTKTTIGSNNPLLEGQLDINTDVSNSNESTDLSFWKQRWQQDGTSILTSGRCMDEEIKNFEFSLVEHYGLSVIDVNEIVNTMVLATKEAAATASVSPYIITTSTRSQHDVEKGILLGLIDLLNLVLDNLSYETPTYTTMLKPSKEILLASILHYVECMSSQFQGTTKVIRDVLFRRPELERESANTVKLTPSFDTSSPIGDCAVGDLALCLPSTLHANSIDPNSISTERFSVIAETVEELQNVAQPVIVLSPSLSDVKTTSYGLDVTLDDKIFNKTYLSDIHYIVDNAARIKRAEILIQALLREGKDDTAVSVLSNDEAKRIRGLLLTVSDDWRALAIRCIACLFRLDGIVAEQASSSSLRLTSSVAGGVNEYQTLSNRRTPEIVRTAREALRVYATLSEQLGLHRLKAKIEDRAFQILYRRQYATVRQLYSCHEQNDFLHTAATLLRKQVEQTLVQDAVLMSQVESIQVTARVKEPYSFWRKLLKTKRIKSNSRLQQFDRSKDDIISIPFEISHEDNESAQRNNVNALIETVSSKQANQTCLSMTDVHDTVALRVIIRGRKWHHDECDNVTDAREIVLCYYVQNCLMEHWPSTRISKMKDYIRHPKPNGYRSLHYTGQHKFNVLDQHTLFPFEIQIRSERMHNIAEFGVANHWEYKLHDVDDDNDDHRTAVKLATDHTSDFLLHTMNFTRAIDSTDRLLNFDHIYQEPYQMSSIARSNISHLVGTSTSTRNLYLDALSNVRQEIANHQVFVFTVTSTSTNGDYEKYNDSEHNSGGNLLSFPINANVRDVLKTICRHSSMNSTNNVRQDPCVLRNGRLARMSDKIQNGDILILQV